MEISERINALKSFGLFDELDESVLHSIAAELELEYYPENATVVTQGDYGDKLYFIVDGIVEAYIINKQGNDVIVGVLTKGNYFGELALLTDGFRNNSVKAKTNCTFLSLPKKMFERLLDKYVTVNKAFIKLLSQRLRNTLQLITEKKESIVILMICSDESIDRENHFKNYFRKMSSRPILDLEGNISKEKLIKGKLNDNHYLLVKTTSHPPEYLIRQADYIINFVEEAPGHFCLTHHANSWKIENTVRRITQKTVGIALCSGGIPGIAHLGVLKVIKEEGIPLDYIVGTSAGAAYGACYAFGRSLDEIEKIILEDTKKSKFIFFITLLRNLSFGFKGIISSNFDRKFMAPLIGDVNFEDALIPFSVVASDLYTGKTIIFKSGKVIDGVIASNAAAVISEPIEVPGQLLIDGVATAPLPIQVLIEEKIDIKIAVPIPQLDLATVMTEKSKMFAIYLRSRSMMAEKMTNLSTELADVIIRPQVEKINMLDIWTNIPKIIEAGEIAARTAIRRIRYLLARKASPT